jgi:spermidine synthase
MRSGNWLVPILALSAAVASHAAAETIVFETTSAYHHIRVVDENRMRTLFFDSAAESRMSLDDPLQGHFEYVEYLHLPWLWNESIRSVLVIGLGGGSVQRTYQARYLGVDIETAELDPAVIEAARSYFNLKESPGMKVIAADGRQFIRRSTKKYDLIVLDAYTTNRYGSGIPYSLVTREFFQLIRQHLTDNGILAYNVIGSVEAGQSSILAALYTTMKTAFPRISLFPAEESGNVVMIAPASGELLSLSELMRRADQLIRSGFAKLPDLANRAGKLLTTPPQGAANALVLSDDFAPVDGMLQVQPRGATLTRKEVDAIRKTLTDPAKEPP